MRVGILDTHLGVQQSTVLTDFGHFVFKSRLLVRILLGF